MKRWYKNIFICCLGVAAVLSCEKQPVEDPALSEQLILLDTAPGANDTKGFLNSGGLAVDGTKFQTYDYLSGYRGTVLGHQNGAEFEYINNTITYKGDATDWKWLFGNVATPDTYRWTRTGTHHFFGWLMADGNDASLNTSSFFDTYSPSIAVSTESNSNKSLVLAKSFTVDSPQYDFLYSDVIPVDVTINGAPAKVDMPMKHLFGALGITITNTSKLDVIVYGVRLKNFPGNGTATLTYDLTTGVDVTHPDPTSAGTYTYWPNKLPAITLYNINHATLSGKVYDCYTGTELVNGAQPSFRMCWPMTFTAIEPVSTGTDGDGNPIYTASSPMIEVDCKVGAGSRSTLTFRFPRLEGATNAIAAGKKTQLNLNFADKQVILSYDILPWQYKEYPMAFEDDAVSTTQLKFTENTFVSLPKVTDASGRHDVIQLTQSSTEGAYVAKGTFKIYTPVNAQLIVTLGGNGEDFVVSLDSGTTATGGNNSITIDPHRDGGLITLRIRPKGTPRSGSKCYLHFTVLNAGREADADTEINRDNYMIVIP